MIEFLIDEDVVFVTVSQVLVFFLEVLEVYSGLLYFVIQILDALFQFCDVRFLVILLLLQFG
jgi:hypothetical protein